MKRPSHHYADYLHLISRITFLVLALAFLALLINAFGLLGEPLENLVEAWESGRSPFWTEGAHPVAWTILLPPLIPLVGSFYLAVVFARFRQYRFGVLALLQGMVISGATLFFFL